MSDLFLRCWWDRSSRAALPDPWRGRSRGEHQPSAPPAQGTVGGKETQQTVLKQGATHPSTPSFQVSAGKQETGGDVSLQRSHVWRRFLESCLYSCRARRIWILQKYMQEPDTERSKSTLTNVSRFYILLHSDRRRHTRIRQSYSHSHCFSSESGTVLPVTKKREAFQTLTK